MPMDGVLRFFGRTPKKHEGVSGFTLEVELLMNWGDESHSYSTKAAYIPTNEGHHMSKAFADKIDAHIDPNDGTTEVCWRNRSSSSKSKPFILINKEKFAVTQNLPLDIVFGRYDRQERLRGFPHPFRGATKQFFNRSFDLSKPDTSRTMSWKQFVEKTLPGGFFNRTKANSKRPSITATQSPATATTSRLVTNEGTASHKLEWNEVSSFGKNRDQRRDNRIFEQQDRASSKSFGMKPVASAAAEEQVSSPSNEPVSSCETCEVPSIPLLHYNSTERDCCKARHPKSSNWIPMTYDSLEHGAEELQIAPILESQKDSKIVGYLSREPTKTLMTTARAISKAPVRNSNLRAGSEPSHDLRAALYTEDIAHKVPEPHWCAHRKDEPQTVFDMSRRDLAIKPTASTIELASQIESALLQVDVPRLPSTPKGSVKSRSSKKSRTRVAGSKEGSVSQAAKAGADDSDSRVIPQYTLPPKDVNGTSDKAVEIPRNHGQITSYAVKRFVEQDTEDTQVVEQSAYSRPQSIQSSSHKPTKPKRLRNRQGLPRVRASKSNGPDAVGIIDSNAAPRSDAYWTWDDDVKQYFHIESDTQSTYWYENSGSDSEEELRLDTRETSPIELFSQPRNCGQGDSGCVLLNLG